ncbi:CoA transferase [Xanthobacter sp. KR7-225]|uniref:CaiB/BaiF CoA transferase family protein n=1 Tax=Xanthobacter sp. KR7-225 TaxID=3156613 RepID=UPI0032B35450
MLPLSGVKVIEFCEVASGPFCGMLLADMGAEVIKVEREGVGDSLRQWPPLSNGYSENFASLNRGKKSITLDLKNPAEREIARRLIQSADAVVENYRPGVMDKNGLGYAAMAKDKPALVYCSISAFGQTGPRSHEGGFDLTIQAVGGVMSVTGEPDGAPVKCGVPVSDFAAGLYAAFAIAAALRKAQASGEGDHIDISMLGATLAIAALQTSEYFGTGIDPQKLGSAHPRNAPYQAFKAKDGYFAMAAGNDRLWRSVCELVGRPDLVEDPRFLTTSTRTRNQTELRLLLEEVFATKSAAEWIEGFVGVGVPCGAINSYSQILADPQVAHMGWVRETTLPSGVTTKTFASPVMLSGKGIEIRSAPPALGEHRAEVIRALDDTPPMKAVAG